MGFQCWCDEPVVGFRRRAVDSSMSLQEGTGVQQGPPLQVSIQHVQMGNHEKE